MEKDKFQHDEIEDIADESGWNFLEFNNDKPPLNHITHSSTQNQNEKKISAPFSDLISLNKNKILGTFYNIYQRFPTDPPIFNSTVIWTLGNCYELLPNEKKNRSSQYPHANRFLNDVERTFIWMTYRKDFPCIEEYNTTTDIGWGCMIRTAQMMLAKVLLIPNFTRDWLSSNTKLWQFPQYRSILELFGDSNSAPFSIHNLILQNSILRGGYDQKDIINDSEWFSLYKIGKALDYVVNSIKPEGIIMYVPSDGIIYINKVLALCETNSNMIITHNWNPIFILVASRIGLDKLNRVYIQHLQHILRSPYCVGIIGGKPRESVYFIGYQDQHIIYLDPHFVQPFVLHSEGTTQREIQTYQCKVPLKMPMVDIDPSIAVGFFFSSRSDFDLFVKDQEIFASKHTSIFTVEKNEPDYVQSEEAEFKFINLNK